MFFKSQNMEDAICIHIIYNLPPFKRDPGGIMIKKYITVISKANKTNTKSMQSERKIRHQMGRLIPYL